MLLYLHVRRTSLAHDNNSNPFTPSTLCTYLFGPKYSALPMKPHRIYLLKYHKQHIATAYEQIPLHPARRCQTQPRLTETSNTSNPPRCKPLAAPPATTPSSPKSHTRRSTNHHDNTRRASSYRPPSSDSMRPACPASCYLRSRPYAKHAHFPLARLSYASES